MTQTEPRQEQPRQTSKRSDIPPLFMLQVLEEGRWNEDAKIMSKLLRREISRGEAFFRLHPLLGIFAVLLGAFSLLMLISH